MSQENVKLVENVMTAVTIVIIAFIGLKVVIVEVGRGEKTADTVSEPTTADSAPVTRADSAPITRADAAPATKSCGDFPLHLRDVPGSLPIKVEVLEGNIPCRVGLREIKDRYREHPLWHVDAAIPVTTGSWSCHGVRLSITTGITICEKNRGRRGTIRGRVPCRYWGPLRSTCQNKFGPP
jgi:hypothetical protein